MTNGEDIASSHDWDESEVLVKQSTATCHRDRPFKSTDRIVCQQAHGLTRCLNFDFFQVNSEGQGRETAQREVAVLAWLSRQYAMDTRSVNGSHAISITFHLLAPHQSDTV